MWEHAHAHKHTPRYLQISVSVIYLQFWHLRPWLIFSGRQSHLTISMEFDRVRHLTNGSKSCSGWLRSLPTLKDTVWQPMNYDLHGEVTSVWIPSSHTETTNLGDRRLERHGRNPRNGLFSHLKATNSWNKTPPRFLCSIYSFIYISACFRQFCSSLRKDSVANYGSIWTQFPPSVGRLDVLYKTH